MSLKPVSKKLKEPLFLVDSSIPQILPYDTIFCNNGYDFADRLLEDVMFKAKLSEDRKTITVFDSSDPDYLQDLNADKWMKEALNYFIESGSEYVFPDNNKHQSDLMLLTESQLEEFFPNLFENRFDSANIKVKKIK